VLTLHQLQVFVTIAEHGSVRRAAEELVVTQPAVSASLAALQREVGVDLVMRAGRGIELTEAGRTFERYARVLLGTVEEAVNAARFCGLEVEAPVRLGASTALADHMLMPRLARLREHRPTLQFTVEVGNRSRLWHMLAERSIDVAVCSRPPANAHFTSLASRPNDYVLVAKPGLVWPGKVGEVTWLVREEGSGTRSAADEVITRLGIAPSLMVISSNAAIQRSAEAGLGVALLPQESVAEQVKHRQLTVVRTGATPLKKPWHVVVRSDAEPAAGVRQFVEDLVSIGGDFEWHSGALTFATPRKPN
jgi:DNA-binding transcriptional LysR family regulator